MKKGRVMGFQKVAYLYCDGNFDGCECADYCYDGGDYLITEHCEASFGDSPYTTIKEYKADMEKQGWKFIGNKAYCSNCYKKRNCNG